MSNLKIVIIGGGSVAWTHKRTVRAARGQKRELGMLTGTASRVDKSASLVH